MSLTDDLMKERVKWLTKALRGLLKTEFPGDQYYQMAVGREDTALAAREAALEQGARDFEAFLKEPSDSAAQGKLNEMLGLKKEEP